MLIETVKVKSDDTEMGYVIMNKSDVNPAEHVLFDDAPTETAATSKKSAK